MINQQTSIAKNGSFSRPKSGVSRQGVPRRPISASMSSKKPKGSTQFLETPKAPPEKKSLRVGGTKVMNIHTEQARMHLKAPAFIAAVAENNLQNLLTEAKANDLNRSMNTSQNTSYDYRSNEKSWRHNDWSQRNQSNVLNSTLQFIPLNNSFVVSQDLKAATVTNLPAVSKKPKIDTSKGGYILPQKIILSPSNSRDRTEQIPSSTNFQDYTPSETPVVVGRGSVMQEVIPGTLYDHLKTFLKKHTDSHQETKKSKRMIEKPPKSKEESKAKMSAVKLYYPYPQVPTQRTSRDSSNQMKKNEKMLIVDQQEEDMIKARMRDSLLKNLLDTIAKASKTEIQNNITNESEKVLLKERIPSSSYGEENNNQKRKGRLLLEHKTENIHIPQNNEERYPFVKSLHRDFRKKRAKENYNPTSRVVNTTFEEATPRLPSFYKPLKATPNMAEPIIFVKRITEQMPPKKRYSIPIKDIPPVVENKTTARMNITTGRGRNQSLSSYRRFKECSVDSQPSSRAPTSKRLRISDAVPFVRQSYGNRTLEKELKLQKEKNDGIEGWDVDVMDIGRWNSPINFNNKDWSPNK